MDHKLRQSHSSSDPHSSHKISPIQGGHGRHAGHSVAMFRDKFWLSFALTIPVVFWSTDVEHWLRYKAPSFPGSNLIPPILGTVVFVYGGLVFIRGAKSELAEAIFAQQEHKLGRSAEQIRTEIMNGAWKSIQVTNQKANIQMKSCHR